ncbi:MAG: putative toxin-antitoxin system toxin component, PIN family [Treponema sp.]|nr:putative toxin-antitoxin system toxin component, PIN family [Treponema sp.]
MRVFIDANIVVSAILFPRGKTAHVFSHLLERHTIIISSYTKKECIKVFQKKFPEKISQLEVFFDGIHYEFFKTPDKIDIKKFPKMRDVKDLPVLATAILSDADVLLTGDKDFDDVKIERLLIFTPTKYYEFIKR